MSENHKDKNHSNSKNQNHGKDKTLSSIERVAQLTEELKAREEEIGKLKDELASVKDSSLRIRADAENYKKRAEKDAISASLYATEALLRDLVPNIDSLTIAIKGASDENVKKGLEIVYDSLLSVMKKHGVEEIDVLGKEFDPNTCEAFLFEDNPESDIDTVAEVLQQGFRLHDKVLRSAKVKVAKGTKA